MEITVKGRKFQVEISDKGMFSVDLDDRKIHAETLNALKSRLESYLKQKPIAIEFASGVNPDDYRWRRGFGEKTRTVYVRRGTITGLHSSNRNLIVRWKDNGQTEQVSRWSGNYDQFMKLTPEQEKTYVELRKVKKKAEDELEKFTKAHSFNAIEEVQKLQGAKVEE
jgi:hypothetical protein